MDLTRPTSIATRVFFVVAFVLFGLGVAEWLALTFGYTIMGEAYRPGRLLEFGTIAVTFVVALLLRQIRDELRKAKG